MQEKVRQGVTNANLPAVMSILKAEARKWREPSVTEIARGPVDPFKVLVSTILSLRTKDAVTGAATERLWKIARTPQELAALDQGVVERAIYPAGFYHTKARVLRELSVALMERFGSRVPDDIETLLTLKGVGRKTANLVVLKAYGKPAICVDTHVHRITNRWSYARTRTPEETEKALRRKLPIRYWPVINDLLVSYGQHVCMPVSPICSQCRIRPYCPQRGVTRFR